MLNVFKKITSVFKRESKEVKVKSETVYWVGKGKTYHKYKDCIAIKNSANIIEGVKESCPKEALCEICKQKDT